MIKGAKNVVWIIAIAVYVWLFLALQLWQINLKQLMSVWGIFTIVLITDMAGLVISCIGMIAGKKSAEKAFLIFNGIYLMCGFYLVYFAWTFYIFKVPTLMERIVSTRNALAFGVLMPLLLFYYLERRGKAKG